MSLLSGNGDDDAVPLLDDDLLPFGESLSMLCHGPPFVAVHFHVAWFLGSYRFDDNTCAPDECVCIAHAVVVSRMDIFDDKRAHAEHTDQ